MKCNCQKGAIQMNKIKDKYEFLEKTGSIILTKDITNAGFHRSVLQEFLDENLIIKLDRGIYIKSDSFEDEFLILQKKYSKGIFSDETALFLLGYSDRTPFKFNMTFPRGYHCSSIKNENIIFKTSVNNIYNIGITNITSPYGNNIRVYDLEKTICDILRGTSNTDIQIVLDAVKKYAKSKYKDINKLMKYADILRVKDKVLNYMEVLL